MAEAAHVDSPTRGRRKMRIGIVTSDNMQKTIVVRVDRLTRHPLYPRTITRGARFKVHDESNDAKMGDLVEIMETRPLSKDKRWRLVKIRRRASTAPPVPGEPSEEPKPEAPEASTSEASEGSLPAATETAG